MDQVKEYFAAAVKHGFWIGSAVILLSGVAVWFLSTTELNEQTEKQISKIKQNATTISSTRNELPKQPNDLSHAKMNVLIEGRTDEVLKAWQEVFDAQTNILTWPEIMQEEFLNEFQYVKDPETGKVDKNKLKLPFEKYEEFDSSGDGESIPPELLRRYERYIGNSLPNLAEICKAKWTAKFDRPTGGIMGGMGGDMMGDMMGMGTGRRASNVDELTGETAEPVVAWSSGSQDALLKDLFPWRGRQDYPSELDVYYSQENLWILRQLLQVIAEVNGDAKQRFEAKIREIKMISMGRSVKFDQGNISVPGSRASGGFGGMGGMMGMGMGMGDMSGMDDYGDMGGGDYADMMGGMGGGEVEASPDPGDNRYVNTAFEPIDASTLRSAFGSNDPGQVAIAVAKRLPIMMRFQMDQRSIPKLLAACGNAALTVDVHQVRIMPKGGGSAVGGMGGMGDMMGGMGDMMGGMGDMMGGGMTGSVGAKDDEFPMDMEVEIYGLIYFYNPPSEESLGLEKVVDDVSIDDTVETLPGPSDTAPSDPPTDTTTMPPAVDDSGANEGPSGGGDSATLRKAEGQDSGTSTDGSDESGGDQSGDSTPAPGATQTNN
ncbi:MAG: hypothetical protein AAF802_24050 [Planctomycetota bacterium]